MKLRNLENDVIETTLDDVNDSLYLAIRACAERKIVRVRLFDWCPLIGLEKLFYCFFASSQNYYHSMCDGRLSTLGCCTCNVSGSMMIIALDP